MTSSVPDSIAQAIRQTIRRHEGGYVAHPHDPGGETKYGISKRSYPYLDIKRLTLGEAVLLYYHDWWHGHLKFLASVSDAAVAAKIFDIGINIGGRRVVRLVQTALNNCGCRIAVDGVAGSATRQALAAVEGQRFLLHFREQAAAYYRSLAASRPSMQVFLKGWLRRAMA